MSGTRTASIDTAPLDLGGAQAIEAAEMRAWTDLYAAAPPDFAASAGVDVTEIGGVLVLRWAATGRRCFSRTIGLGVTRPATPEAIDRILGHFGEAGIDMFLLQSLPHCRPEAYEAWLGERGLEAFDEQDRVVRGSEPLAGAVTGELAVERVGHDAQDEWAEFVQRVYRLDTGGWLQALVSRPGWHQYVARDGGEVVAARGIYIGVGGIAWMGI